MNGRALTERERALISAVIARLPQETARPLAEQIDIASVGSGDGGTVLDIDVPASVIPTQVADGPLPVRALVASDAGEIIVWVSDGRLSGLEFAWVTDDPPERWPPPEDLTFPGP